MFIHQLYQKFHVFIHLDKYLNCHIILDFLSTIYYSNYQIYILTKNTSITFNHPFVEIVLLTNNFQQHILEYVKKIPYNENIAVIEKIDDYLNENILLELNTFFVKEKPKLIIINEASHNLFLWTCKSGILNELLLQINVNEYEQIEILSCCCNFVGEDKIKNIGNYKFTQNDLIKFSEKHHILFATYQRNENLQRVFDMLSKQSVKNIHIHLLDNNEDSDSQKEIDEILNKYNFLHITLHRFNKNLHCFGRITLTKKITETCVLDYIIIFDDDQLYDEDWLENMISQKQPLSTLSWYGKNFTVCDYWKSTIWYSQIEKKKRPDVKEWNYFGPGGSIIDINLFLFQELYNYEKYSPHIKGIDDIWMSFIFKRYLNITFHRILTPPIECIDWKNKKKMTWCNLKNEKNVLFQYLSNEFDWDVTKKNIKTSILNTFFDSLYILYNEKDNINELISKTNNWNICCYFEKIIENNHLLVRNKVIKKNESKTILFLDSNLLFDDFFLHKIQKKFSNLQMNSVETLFIDSF